MSQRVSSDHPSITTVQATLAQSGRTDRPKIELPPEQSDHFPQDEVVRLVLDESEHRAYIERQLSGDGLMIRGAYDTPSLARNPGEGENRLHEWYEAADIDFGRTVHVDIIEESFQYGIREPGERTVYETAEAPDESLSSIAENLEQDS